MTDTRCYAIGDIHGHFDKLLEVHEWIRADQVQHGAGGKIVHVGDLTDRGPDSAKVVDWLMKGVDNGEPWVVLKGNHDRLMSYYLSTPSRADPCLNPDYTWLSQGLGGETTLLSYGVDISAGDDPRQTHASAVAAVPVQHRQFLENLPLMYQSSGAVFVHAGIKPRVALKDQVEDDLVWIRAEFHNYRRDHEALIVHGHTPVDVVRHYGNRVNIDTGVAFGGPLTVVVVENGEVWNLRQEGRTVLSPS